MRIHNLSATIRMQLLAIFSVIFIAGCGGGGSSAEPVVAPVTPLPSTGTVGLLFTDAPTDEFESILLTVTDAILIGGDDKQEILFEGAEPIDLLNLTRHVTRSEQEVAQAYRHAVFNVMAHNRDDHLKQFAANFSA